MQRCGVCGSKELEKNNIKGTTHPWKDYLQVELLYDQDCVICQKCGNQIMTPRDLAELDKNIVASIKTRIDQAIRVLTERFGVTQENVARALGVTPEYLSMVKNGNKRLSFTTFNLLQCFKGNPNLITSLTGIEVINPTSEWKNFVSRESMISQFQINIQFFVSVLDEWKDFSLPKNLNLGEQVNYSEVTADFYRH